MAKAIVLFLTAGLSEIGGGYLVWLWLRKSKPLWVGVLGGMILVLYGIIPCKASPTLVACTPPMAERLFYWRCSGDGLWTGKTPDLYDWIGALICMIGVSVMLWAPRS